VPGPASAGHDLLDGNVERRGRAAQPQVPALPKPPERGGVESEVPDLYRREPEATGSRLPVNRADAHGERALPVRRKRCLARLVLHPREAKFDASQDFAARDGVLFSADYAERIREAPVVRERLTGLGEGVDEHE